MLSQNTHLTMLSGFAGEDPDDDSWMDEALEETGQQLKKEELAAIPKAVAGDKTAQTTVEISDDPEVKAAYKKALEAKLKSAKTDKEKSVILDAIKSAGSAGIKIGHKALSLFNKMSAELQAASGKAGSGKKTAGTSTDNTVLYITLGVALFAFMALSKK